MRKELRVIEKRRSHPGVLLGKDSDGRGGRVVPGTAVLTQQAAERPGPELGNQEQDQAKP